MNNHLEFNIIFTIIAEFSKMPPRPMSATDSLDEAVDNFHQVATVLKGATSSSSSSFSVMIHNVYYTSSRLLPTPEFPTTPSSSSPSPSSSSSSSLATAAS